MGKLVNWIKKADHQVFCAVSLIVLVATMSSISIDWRPSSANQLGTLVSAMMSGFVAFVAIWFSGYYVLQESLRDKVPSELLKRRYDPIAKSTILGVILVLAAGTVSLCLNLPLMQVAFSISSLIYICFLLVMIYKMCRSFQMAGYVEDVVGKMVNEKLDHPERRADRGVCGKLNNLFVECLARKEYFVCLSIQQKLRDLVKAHHEGNPRALLEGKEDAVSIAMEDYDAIIGVLDLNLAEIDDSISVSFMAQLFKVREELINDCVKLDHFDLFRRCMDGLFRLAFHYAENRQIIAYRYCLSCIGSCFVYCDKLGKQSYANLCMERCREIALASSVVFESAFAQEWIREFVTIFYKYDILSEEGRKFTKDLIFECSVSEVRDNGSLRSIVEPHVAFFKEILRIGDESLIREYFEFARTTLCCISEDELWAVNVLFFIEQVEEGGYSSLQRDIDRLRVACCCAQIDMHRGNSYLRLSKYEERLSGSYDDEGLVGEAIEDVKTVLYESIRKGSYRGVRLATSSISKLVEATQRDQRKMQYDLLAVLLDGLDYAAFTDSRVSFEAIMQSLDEIIRDLDNSSRMSEGLFKDMLGGVFSFCWTLRGYSRQQYEDRVVRFLADLLGKELELRILFRKKELRKFYYDKWLKLGVDCLEEGDEKTLRQVSNYMGWQIAHSMKSGQNGDAQYILDCVFRLHNLSETFAISKNTRVFLLTLFTVIGSYTFTNQSFIPLRQKIVEHLVAFDQEEIEVATEIRFMPDDTWDELFPSEPQEYSRLLIGEICSAKKKNTKM